MVTKVGGFEWRVKRRLKLSYGFENVKDNTHKPIRFHIIMQLDYNKY